MGSGGSAAMGVTSVVRSRLEVESEQFMGDSGLDRITVRTPQTTYRQDVAGLACGYKIRQPRDQ